MLARQVFQVIGRPAAVISGASTVSTYVVVDPVSMSSDSWPGGVSEMARCYLLRDDVGMAKAGDVVQIDGVDWRVHSVDVDDGEVVQVMIARNYRPNQR